MKIALLGLGTVGSGVLQLIQRRQQERQCSQIEIAYIFARRGKKLPDNVANIKVTDSIDEILESDVEIIVEMLGGIDFSYEIIKKAIQRGKHIVTANKDLLAQRQVELNRLANQHQVTIAYEASCGGGIPIVQALRYGMCANQVTAIQGILNGTSNYILTKMTQENWSYQEALLSAQHLGYAEKDPTNDVGGFDTARKLLLLSRMAYKSDFPLTAVTVQGMDKVTLIDVMNAKKLGYIFKLIGQSVYHNGAVQMSVAPMLVRKTSTLAQCNDANNAVLVNGDAVGELFFQGAGAGSFETASAVVADILFVEQFGFIRNQELLPRVTVNNELSLSAYYLQVSNQLDTIQSVLASLGLNATIEPSEQGMLLLTGRVSEKQLTQLLQVLDVVSYYQIVGG